MVEHLLIQDKIQLIFASLTFIMKKKKMYSTGNDWTSLFYLKLNHLYGWLLLFFWFNSILTNFPFSPFTYFHLSFKFKHFVGEPQFIPFRHRFKWLWCVSIAEKKHTHKTTKLNDFLIEFPFLYFRGWILCFNTRPTTTVEQVLQNLMNVYITFCVCIFRPFSCFSALQ